MPKSPMKTNLYHYIKNVDWEDNEFSIEKAYICSTISKLIYQYKKRSPKDRVNFYDLTQKTIDIDEDLRVFATLFQQEEVILLFVLESPYGITVGVSVGNATIIACRGTNYWKDWCINLNLLKSKTVFSKVKFHKGYNKIADISIFKIWNRLIKINNPIYFTGHSLGAAVTVILFLKFNFYFNRYFYKPRIVSAYTFGMPRFFNRNLFPFGNIHHFYNNLDIVPKIPFKIAGFKNLPYEYTFDNNENLISTIKRKRFQFIKSVKLLITKKLILEHNIDLYSNLIRKNIK